MMPDAWVDELVAELAEDEPALAAGELRHRVVLWPTFHPQALISVRFGEVATLRVAARVGPWAPGDPPVMHAAEVAVGAGRAAELRAVLTACVGGLAEVDDRRGCDGVTLAYEVEVGGAEALRVVAWSPEPGQVRHRHVAALHAAASELVVDEQAQQTLKQLHGYLSLGSPVRDHGGTPRRLEIFGQLGSDSSGVLAGLFACVGEAEAVVVDMRDFEGMGTLLYPLFRRFSRRSGPIAWVVSAIGRQQLHAAKVASKQLFRDLDAALGYLAAAAGVASSP